jgi:hypothetical protein
MSHPPHLPPKTCSVPFYKRLRLVESIIFIAVFAFISGLVGGIISDTYITPEYDAYTSVIRNQQAKVPSSVPDPLLVSTLMTQTVSLVPRALYEQTRHVTPDTSISAVLLTDTGWFVAPLPPAGMLARNWVAVSTAGVSYDIESLVVDSTAGVVYGFLDGNGFRVVSFSTVETLTAGTNVWTQSFGSLKPNTLAEPMNVVAGIGARSAGASPYSFMLTQPVPDGSVVWTQDGMFVGFLNKESGLLPWFVIQSVYTDVFTHTPIVHLTVPMQGHIVVLSDTEHALTGAQFGLYVTQIDRGVDSDVRVDDIVVSIAGKTFFPWTLDAVIAEQRAGVVNVRVLEDGQLVEKKSTLVPR